VTEALAQTGYMLIRQARNLLREPIWIALLLIQPMVWLLLYSQLFERVTNLGGFGTASYADFFLPGVVVMNAFFAGTWAGMSMVTDIDRGVLERFLATPARRSSLVSSQLARAALQSFIQGLILLLVGYAIGARVAEGLLGWLVILGVAMLVAAGFAGISHGVALLTRKEATMIAVANFIGLPLMFLSTILIARAVIPGWMQTGSKLNPVDWAVRAARGPALPGTDWGDVGVHVALLAAFVAATGAFATWAFRAYQRTL
jgi:ABC-2 type transport system permease protein